MVPRLSFTSIARRQPPLTDRIRLPPLTDRNRLSKALDRANAADSHGQQQHRRFHWCAGLHVLSTGLCGPSVGRQQRWTLLSFVFLNACVVLLIVGRALKDRSRGTPSTFLLEGGPTCPRGTGITIRPGATQSYPGPTHSYPGYSHSYYPGPSSNGFCELQRGMDPQRDWSRHDSMGCALPEISCGLLSCSAEVCAAVVSNLRRSSRWRSTPIIWPRTAR